MRPVAVAAALSCVLASLALAAPAWSETQSEAASRLALEAELATIVPSGAGCVAGVSLPGAPPVIVARGQADLEHPAPLTPASVLETGSLAKQFTAAAVVLLAQDGKLDLDGDIRRYLPEMPDYGAPITVRHLLSHTSGLREQWSLMALAGNGPGSQVHTNAMILDMISRQKSLNFAPGAEFLYTNTNYVLAAIIVERVSGTSLQGFTENRLFRPLGMDHTLWREDFRTVVPGRASAYAPTETGFMANMPFTSVYGNGGLLTTAGDLLRWNAFLDAPSVLPGGAALAAALQTPGRLSRGAPLDYALGLEVTRDHGWRLVSHSGSTAGYKTWLGRFPDAGVSIALMCNNGGVDPVAMGSAIGARVMRATGHALVDNSAPEVRTAGPIENLAPYEGLFRDPVTGDLARLKAADGKLILTRGASQALAALGEGRFQADDGGVFRFAQTDGPATAVTLTRGAITQTFAAVRPASNDPAALDAYAGTYYSAELDTRITVIRKGDALVMRQPFAVEWPLSPSFADGFSTRLRGITTFLFSRGADGQVTGFGAWAGGARNVVFVRQ